MNREQKAATIEALAAEIDGADAIFAVDYRGISVSQVAELRTKLREADASFRVVKNSLTERAADQVGAESLKSLLAGPTALTFVRGDAATAAKAIADQARATQLLPFKGGLMNGDVLDAEQIRSISRLPSRELLYGQLVGIVASPISGLVRTLNALVGGLAVALGQVREKKESGEIPAGEAPEAAVASEMPAGESAVEEAGSEDAGAEEASAEEASAGEVSTGEASAEGAAEEAAAEEASAEGAAEEASAEESAAGEASAGEAVAEEAPAEGAGPEEASAESAAEEITAEEPAAKTPAEGSPEASSPEHKAEPAAEPAQDDNQADASARVQPDSAEATKED